MATATPKKITNNLKESENVKIYCRIKDMQEDTLTNSNFDIIVGTNTVEIKNKDNKIKEFVFDGIFNGNISQRIFYEKSVKEGVYDMFVNNKNLSVLLYGNSNSGKTYTAIGDQLNPGLLPIIIREFTENKPFYLTNKELNSHNKLCDFRASLQVLEIYNEKLKDLNGSSPNDIVRIRENKDGIILENLTSFDIQDFPSFLVKLKTINQNRIIKQNAHNDNSSRSHCIFIIKVLKILKNGEIISNNIYVTDLAGSERNNQETINNGLLLESGCINKSLLALARCFKNFKLGEKIPFRDSKLTQILYNTFNSETNISIILNLQINDPKRCFEDQYKLMEYVNCAKYFNAESNHFHTKTKSKNKEKEVDLDLVLKNGDIGTILFNQKMDLINFEYKQNEEFIFFKAQEKMIINKYKNIVMGELDEQYKKHHISANKFVNNYVSSDNKENIIDN